LSPRFPSAPRLLAYHSSSVLVIFSLLCSLHAHTARRGSAVAARARRALAAPHQGENSAMQASVAHQAKKKKQKRTLLTSLSARHAKYTP
jgi:hypothetical protein